MLHSNIAFYFKYFCRPELRFWVCLAGPSSYGVELRESIGPYQHGLHPRDQGEEERSVVR